MTSSARRSRCWRLWLLLALGPVAVPGTHAQSLPPAISWSTPAANAEGTSVLYITVKQAGTLATPPSGTLSLRLWTVDGTAKGGNVCTTTGPVDYVAVTNHQVTLVGTNAVQVPVVLCDDAVFEGDETFRLLAARADGGPVTPGSITVTIRDNDPPPYVVARLEPSDSVAEPAPGVSPSQGRFTVTIGAQPNGGPWARDIPVTLRLERAEFKEAATVGATCGVDGTDIALLSPAQGVIPASTSSAANAWSITFELMACQDALYEGPEPIDLRLELPPDIPPWAVVSPLSFAVNIVDAQLRPALVIGSAEVRNVGTPTGGMQPTLLLPIELVGATPQYLPKFSYRTADGTAVGGSSCSSGVHYLTQAPTQFTMTSRTAFLAVPLCNLQGAKGRTVQLILDNIRFTSTERAETLSRTIQIP